MRSAGAALTLLAFLARASAETAAADVQNLRGVRDVAESRRLFGWWPEEPRPRPASVAQQELTQESGEVESVASVSRAVWRAVTSRLNDPAYQWADMVVALTFGLILVESGKFFFKWLVILALGVLAMLIALSDISVTMDEKYQGGVRYVIGLEVFLVASYAAWKAYDGVLLAAGALVGYYLAYEAEGLLVLVDHNMTVEQQQWRVVMWYSVIMLGCMLMVHTKMHEEYLAVIAPFIGGALLSSACSWMLTLMALQGQMDWLVHIVPQFQPGAMGSWFEFLLLLVDPQSKDVGVFANTPFQHFEGKLCLDRILGVALWLVFFVAGALHQRGAADDESGRRSGKGLSESLLAA